MRYIFHILIKHEIFYPKKNEILFFPFFLLIKYKIHFICKNNNSNDKFIKFFAFYFAIMNFSILCSY